MARTFYGGDTTIAPVFQLDIHGAVSENDRTTERTVKTLGTGSLGSRGRVNAP